MATPPAKAPAQGPSPFPGSWREVQLFRGPPWGAGPGTLGRGDPESWPWTPPKEPGSPQPLDRKRSGKKQTATLQGLEHSGAWMGYLVREGPREGQSAVCGQSRTGHPAGVRDSEAQAELSPGAGAPRALSPVSKQKWAPGLQDGSGNTRHLPRGPGACKVGTGHPTHALPGGHCLPDLTCPPCFPGRRGGGRRSLTQPGASG